MRSSFLDVLAARKDPSGLSGEVMIDGAPQPPNFKCLSGYVVQVRQEAADSGQEVSAHNNKSSNQLFDPVARTTW